jgi:hypothetical protein
MVPYDAEAGDFVVKRRAGGVSGKKVAAKAKAKRPVHRRTA